MRAGLSSRIMDATFREHRKAEVDLPRIALLRGWVNEGCIACVWNVRYFQAPYAHQSTKACQGGSTMAPVSVRYIVDDVDAAITFYTRHLGFALELHPAASFAILSRGDLRLLLSAPSGPGGASQPMPDGRRPEPGGWNRIQLQSDDLNSLVESLRSAGARFRNDIVSGIGGKQILLDDSAGNPIELFEPLRT